MARIAEAERRSAATIMSFLLRERLRLRHQHCYTNAHERHFRELCSILLWKHSEAQGKYRGCRFWSEGALQSLRQFGRVVTSKGKIGGEALRHEHLFPRDQLIDLLFDLPKSARNEVRAILDRLNIGVVVTLREHDQLSDEGVESDPWERYRKAGIRWEEIGS